MNPQPASGQGVNETYAILRRAAARRQPVAAIYDDLPRLLCPHVLGRKAGRYHALVYQIGGRSNSGLPVVPSEAGVWRCVAVEKLSQVELRADGWRSEPRSRRPALMKSISTRTLNPETTRRTDSEATAAAADAPERCAMSRSNADYAARGEPRGRKSGAGPGSTNPI